MQVRAIGNGVVITVGPTVSLRDVVELERRLRLLGRVEVLTVDLSRARDLDDWIVAALADAVWGITPAVEFRGESRHHRRLLRYLGHGAVDTPESAPA